MIVSLLDLRSQYAGLQAELEATVLKAMRETRYILGPEVGELETALAKYTGAKYVIACSSGSDALLLRCWRQVSARAISLLSGLTIMRTTSKVGGPMCSFIVSIGCHLHRCLPGSGKYFARTDGFPCLARSSTVASGSCLTTAFLCHREETDGQSQTAAR